MLSWVINQLSRVLRLPLLKLYLFASGIKLGLYVIQKVLTSMVFFKFADWLLIINFPKTIILGSLHFSKQTRWHFIIFMLFFFLSETWIHYSLQWCQRCSLKNCFLTKFAKWFSIQAYFIIILLQHIALKEIITLKKNFSLFSVLQCMGYSQCYWQETCLP